MSESTRLVAIMTAMALASSFVTLQSFGHAAGGQNPTTNLSQREAKPGQAQSPSPGDFSKNTWDIPADADKTKNPVEATDESIAKGKELFMAMPGNCIFCHGETGAGNKENLPRLRRVPADLSDADRMPKLSDGEIFWKITRGINGIMPSREKELTEEQRWHVVNFVRTLSKEKARAANL